MTKGENEGFTKTMRRQIFGQLIAMFASLPSPGEKREQRAIISDQGSV